jgi:hypothetical protein
VRPRRQGGFASANWRRQVVEEEVCLVEDGGRREEVGAVGVVSNGGGEAEELGRRPRHPSSWKDGGDEATTCAVCDDGSEKERGRGRLWGDQTPEKRTERARNRGYDGRVRQ